MENADQIFEAFEKLNVVIVGDVMIDRYLTGQVTRVSPEAPVPVVHLRERDNRLGGAANVALNVKALGATPYLCSVIGKDQNAELLLSLLSKEEMSTKGIVQSSNRVTTVKTRVIAESQHLLRVDSEDAHDLNRKEEYALLEKMKEIIETRDIDIILFQDYNKGVLNVNVIREVILESIKRDIPTAVDPKKENFTTYANVTLFKPNLREVEDSLVTLPGFKENPNSILPIDPRSSNSLKKASNLLKTSLNNSLTLITLSEHGVFIDDGTTHQIIPTQARIIADVCGAGDTVFSVAGLGLAIGLKSNLIATLANLAGGQVCEKVGVVPLDKDQLKMEYNVYLQDQAASKGV